MYYQIVVGKQRRTERKAGGRSFDALLAHGLWDPLVGVGDRAKIATGTVQTNVLPAAQLAVRFDIINGTAAIMKSAQAAAAT